MKKYLILAAAALAACSTPTPTAGRAFSAACRFTVEWHYVETRRPDGVTQACIGLESGTGGEVDALRAACAADGGRAIVGRSDRYTTAECTRP